MALLLLLLLFLGTGYGWLSKRSQQSRCVANLRQMGALATLYSQDHRQHTVPYQTAPAPGTNGPTKLWSHYLLDYSGIPGDWRVSGTLWYGPHASSPDPVSGKGVDFFKCPSQKDPFRIGYRLRYGINTIHTNLAFSRIRELSKAILIADSSDANPDHISYSGSFADARGFMIQNNLVNPIADRHGGGANFLFVDGHIEQIPFREAVSQPGDSAQERARKLRRWDQR